MAAKRIVNVKVLPGQPLDGGGTVCVHLFVADARGPFVEPSVLHPVYEGGVQVKQRVEAQATRGRLACDPRRDAAPVTRRGVTTVTLRTDDPRGVNCPKCKASAEHAEALAKLAALTAAQA